MPGWIAGALAGLFAALADFGAMWLWLPFTADKIAFGLRLLALLVPTGALMGATLDTLNTRFARGRWPASTAWTLTLSPGVLALSVLLFSGGKMSRLPLRPLLIAGVAILLWAALWTTLTLARRLPRPSRVTAIALMAASVGLTKLDQHLYPGLYAYLHACLALGAWLCAFVAFRAWPTHRDRRRLMRWLSTLALSAAWLANLITLPTQQNLWVSMLDPRAANARSALLGLEPLLIALHHTRQTRTARKIPPSQTHDTTTFPSIPGAHVLLITVDALRADHLHFAGYPRATSPFLDALATTSLVFDNAYAQAPHSSYSLTSLHTSEYLHELVELGQTLPGATLASVLGDAGYHTAAFYTLGIFHTEGERVARYHASALGFQLHDHADRDAQATTERVLLELDRVLTLGEPPAFVWAHYFDVHEPYQATSFGTSDRDRYDSEILDTDHAIENLIEGARRRLKRPLIIAITADHGEEFREHGGVYHGSTLYQEQTHVPLLLGLPGIPPAHVEAPVELIDVAPTVLAAAGVAVPQSMRGQDLRLWTPPSNHSAKPAFSAVIYKKSIVAWPYKLIGDLRHDVFELYDLSRDPAERTNLAQQQPTRVDELKAQLYGWTDALTTRPNANAFSVALAQARLNDRRAVGALSQLLLDRQTPPAQRAEAARWLGTLSDDRALPALMASLRSPSHAVADEAAIALGRLFEPRGKARLRVLVRSEDPGLRVRAGIALARLHDRHAVPALIDALTLTKDVQDRSEAILWLGRLRDPRATEPLLKLLPEFELRYLTVLSLGRLAAPETFETLLGVLDWDDHKDVRNNVLAGLGWFHDRRAIPRIERVLVEEPDLDNAPEALIRLGMGLDLGVAFANTPLFARCVEGPVEHDWDFAHRSWCETQTHTAAVTVPFPSTSGDWMLTTALRRVDNASPVDVTLSVGSQPLASQTIRGEWATLRWKLPHAMLTGSTVAVTVTANDRNAQLAWDHVLIVATPR